MITTVFANSEGCKENSPNLYQLRAINNGGLFGVGLGNSTQKYLYLPEAHTDFIFPIIVEELGSVAGAGIILLYAFILFRCLKVEWHSHEDEKY